ncbi:hypothetical protein FO519_006165 [Halicephalobus sp. NKZ332]|nr:hypothetical protein FO519_006165 [Halicephalobus sp. NKZ332]
MKLFIFATLFGLSLAGCDYNTCQSCAGKNGGFLVGKCYWDLATGKCKSTLLPIIAQPNAIPQALSCPTPLPTFQYTDDFGRNTVFPFSMASNADGVENVAKCPAAKLPNVQVLKQYTINCDFLGSPCSVTLFNHSDANALVLAFRGTKGLTQLGLQAVELFLTASKKGSLYNGKVSPYYSNAIDSFWNGEGLGNDLVNYAANRPGLQLWVFGHSLGGSLSTLTANAAVRNGIFSKDRVRLVTMGEPRTGDYEFASEVSSNVPQAYRIVIKADLISKLPTRLDLGATSAYHTNFEAWYNNDMSGPNFVVNNRADDYSGSNTVVLPDLNSHNSYFNFDMDNYVQNFCS